MFDNYLKSLPGDLGFKKNKKLKTDEISSVFNFRHQENGVFFRILYKPSQRLSAKLAIIISKKIASKSVERNYCKRIVRELFRTRQYQARNLELVVLIRKKISRLYFDRAAREFDEILSKIVLR